MKKRLTVNVDAELIASAKRHARDHGVTLSSLVEESLRDLASTDSTLVDGEVSRREPPRGSAPRRPERVGDTEDDSRDGHEIPDFKLPPGDPPRARVPPPGWSAGPAFLRTSRGRLQAKTIGTTT